MAAVQSECDKGDVSSCAYMLTFRTYDLKALSAAVERVQQGCNDGTREACEAGLKIADRFYIVYHDHTLYTLRERFPLEVYKAACLQFGYACAKVDVGQLALTQDQLALIKIRQNADIKPGEVTVRALEKECGDGVVQCRPRDLSFFRKDCPTGPTCFIAAYDSFLRKGENAHELFDTLATAQGPKQWISDAKLARCVSEKGCPEALSPDAVTKLNVYTHPAAALVINDTIEHQVAGNAKLANAMAALETKRAEFNAARKSRARETLNPQLPAPKTPAQSAMYSFIEQREAHIRERVARYE